MTNGRLGVAQSWVSAGGRQDRLLDAGIGAATADIGDRCLDIGCARLGLGGGSENAYHSRQFRFSSGESRFMALEMVPGALFG